MTYRAHLDQLVTVCTLKGKTYMTAKRGNSHNKTYLEHLRRDWEQAEDDFEACLALIMSQKVRMLDIVPNGPSERVYQPGVSFSQS